MYLILLSAVLEKVFTEEEIRTGMLVKKDDQVSIDEKLFMFRETDSLINFNRIAYSPVRGIVENIDYASGTLTIREIQDYPLKPVTVNVAKEIKVKEKNLKGYMKKRVGELVYAGEILAVNSEKGYKSIVSPYTGTIQKVDTDTGMVTICYDKKPHQVFALCYGKVNRVVDDKEVFIGVDAVKVEGKIGFGRDAGGFFKHADDADETDLRRLGRIVYASHVTYEDLMRFADMGINGLVCDSIGYGCLKKYLGKDIGVALTGNEDLPFSLVILKGFSEEALEGECAFEEFVGKYVLIKPHTQIRAGATRPSVCVFSVECRV
jgi:hypothetical protein